MHFSLFDFLFSNKFFIKNKLFSYFIHKKYILLQIWSKYCEELHLIIYLNIILNLIVSKYLICKLQAFFNPIRIHTS